MLMTFLPGTHQLPYTNLESSSASRDLQIFLFPFKSWQALQTCTMEGSSLSSLQPYIIVSHETLGKNNNKVQINFVVKVSSDFKMPY